MKSKLLLTCTILFFCSSFLCGQNQSSKVANSVETNNGCIRHPWQGKRVGYLGDSITDPNCYGDKIKKYWDFLQEWLGGMSGILSIDLPKEERSQNLWLPLTAICHRPQKGDYVWVVKGDKVNSVPVKLGEQRNNQIEIVEGITENDLVVLTRQRFLSENSAVTIQK